MQALLRRCPRGDFDSRLARRRASSVHGWWRPAPRRRAAGWRHDIWCWRTSPCRCLLQSQLRSLKKKEKEQWWLFWIRPLDGEKQSFLRCIWKEGKATQECLFRRNIGSRVHREGSCRDAGPAIWMARHRPLEPLPSKANRPPGMTAFPR